MNDTDPLDVYAIDAYKLPHNEFEKAYLNLGKSTTPAPAEDQPRDVDGKFTTEPLGDAYKMTAAEFNAGWKALGNPPPGDGHPVKLNNGRIAEIRKNYSVTPDPPKKPEERQTA